MTKLSENELGCLPKALSGRQYNTYLLHAKGCETRALELYRWNMGISSRFMVSINITETVLQRAISDSIAASYGEKWPWSEEFLNDLKPPKENKYNPRMDIEKQSKLCHVPEILITKLRFIFWESMLTSYYDKSIWNLHIKDEFPYSPNGYTARKTRNKLHFEMRRIRRFRNKIAHHNPVFRRKLNSEVKRMDMVVR